MDHSQNRVALMEELRADATLLVYEVALATFYGFSQPNGCPAPKPALLCRDDDDMDCLLTYLSGLHGLLLE